MQDFYPTPGTISTAMYYTELDPYTMKPVFVAKTSEEKSMQRALMRYFDPANRELVIKALYKAGRQDLIGNGPKCLVSPGKTKISKESYYKGKTNGKKKK